MRRPMMADMDEVVTKVAGMMLRRGTVVVVVV